MTVSPEIEAALIDLVRKTAKAEIMTRFRQLPRGSVKSKSAPDDLVTEADLEAERAITIGVQDLFPNAVVIGEEAVAAEPALLDKISAAPLSVIVDPVDGTWNFAKGVTTFGVILAVAEFGQTVFGLLYDPVMDDWIVARHGEGAWHMSPGQSPRRLQLNDAEDDQLVGTLPLFHYPPETRERLVQDIAGIRRIWSLRCSCHEYRLLGLGQIDFNMSHHIMRPWDHAAGVLAIKEAGGAVALLDGRPYSAGFNSEGYLIAARSKGTWDRVAEALGPLVTG